MHRPENHFHTLLCVCFHAIGSSAKRHGGGELCSLLNRAIHEDDPRTIIHAAMFAHAINMLLSQDRNKPRSWLRKISPKSYPCVHVGRSCGDGVF